MKYKGYNGYTYVFWGQHATTGSPHPQTGLKSQLGKIFWAISRREAEDVASAIASKFPQDVVDVGGERRMRQYCLGLSMRDFEQLLKYSQEIIVEDITEEEEEE